VKLLRPVTKTLKTAFIFYLIYAVLLSAIALWLPRTEFISKMFSKDSQPFEQRLIEKLHLKQQEYQKSWQKILVDEGYIPKAVYKSRKDQLLRRKVGRRQIEWTSSTSTIVLPKAANKNAILRLTFKWQQLEQSLGFAIHSEKWGYTGGLLWVKLESSFPIRGEKYGPSLPLEHLMLIQPVVGFKGRLPGLIPEIPPAKPDALVAPSTVQPKSIPRVPAAGQLAPLPPNIRKKVRAAIIIDDVGYVIEPAEAMLKVQAPLTFSVLPFGPYSRKYAEAAKERGFGVMLHLPLEPMNPSINPGPGVIKRSFTEEEVVDQLAKDLDQVPEAIGINNHEGSAGTSDERLMGILMKEIKSHQKFFVDSVTIGSSVAYKYACLNQIPCAKRKVFLDNKTDVADEKEALRELIRIALRDGEAIGIGHVRAGTAQAITEMLPEFAKAGVELVPVAQLVK
jgi:polysaccharide deacetylase 2 family uncharacterized protein YibQ